VPNDDDVLPGPALLTAPDGKGDGDVDDGAGRGFLWNAALKAGRTVRNYGFADASVYDSDLPGDVPLIRDPAKAGVAVQTRNAHSAAGLRRAQTIGFAATEAAFGHSTRTPKTTGIARSSQGADKSDSGPTAVGRITGSRRY
jgi:hypothetical protein